MGEFDEYCTVCGGPPSAPCFDMTEGEESQPLTSTPQPNPADYTWLESIVGITNKEEVLPLTAYDNLGSFDILQADTTPYTYFPVGCRNEDYFDEKTARGYACHVSCYNLLQQELNYTLKHADVLPLLIENEYNMNSFHWSDYGGLAEYQEQFFLDVLLVKDGKLWMIEDPSRNEQNKERILKLWRPLVESGFKKPEANGHPLFPQKKPEAKVEDEGSSAPETAATANMDEA